MTFTKRSTLTLCLALAAPLFAVACGDMQEGLIGGSGGYGAGNAGGSGGSGGSGGADQTGVPCDVATVIANQCLVCHGTKPAKGVPISLVTYEDLTAPSAADSSKMIIERSVFRMGNAGAPMPPSGAAAAADIAVLQAWIDAGVPQGSCDTPIEDPFANPQGCVTGKTWNPQGEEGKTMNPGKACNSCHKSEGEGPIFKVAGTVYASGHETDYCYGIDGTSPDYSDVRVEVTDANGIVSSISVGSTGNFSLQKTGFAYPYTAKVVSSKGERAMNAAQTEGDCNTCHTVDAGGAGSMAPGRIVIPL